VREIYRRQQAETEEIRGSEDKSLPAATEPFGLLTPARPAVKVFVLSPRYGLKLAEASRTCDVWRT